MKFLLFSTLLALSANLGAQSPDSLQVQRAALDYIEGFYEGDTLKLQRCLSSDLYKYGYFKGKSGEYEGSQMTYDEAIGYARNVLEKKKFAKEGSPKEVILLDVQSQVACVKVIAWWGLDYILLAKKGDVWRIEQVLWQGPLKTVGG
ncbi:MAG: nuclear transport factor 2 family protein [Saprospiraceae bacterium]|nr:nuclear transport factor 2 family protein [Saprospiraceae bacterium]